MSSSTRSITGVSEPSRLVGRNAFARVIWVLAWSAFWFNAALFPCREAIAAILGDHSDRVSQSVPAAQRAHDSDLAHSECSDLSSSSPCRCNLNAGPAINEVDAGLSPDRVNPEWFAIDVSVVAGLTAVNHPAKLALREYHSPPPPVRLYLHTQRLLI